jgi:hypothetical protein
MKDARLMFNLDKEISAWRTQMLAAGIQTPVPLDELESHLRDGIEQQFKSGLSPQQAFDAAVQRIGQANALKTEFATAAETVSPGILRRFLAFSKALSDVRQTGATQKIQRSFGWISVALVGFILCLTGYAFFKMELSVGQQIAVFGGVASTLFVGCGWRYVVSFVPFIVNRRKRVALAASMFIGLLCWEVLLFRVSDRYNDAGLQYPVFMFWMPLPWITFGTLGIGFMLDESERKRLGIRTTTRKKIA